MDAAQRLAVNRQRFVRQQPLGREPLPQDALEGDVIEAAEGAMPGRHTRSALLSEAERHANRRRALASPVADGIHAAAAAPQGADRERQHPVQALHLPLPAPHIGQRLQRRPHRSLWRRVAPVCLVHAAQSIRSALA
jgi:hypothetical protein